MEAPTQARTDRKRKAVLDAATRVFLRGGHRASMDEIASLAGVSKQTLYKQFGSKDELFVEIVMSTVDRASDQVVAEVAKLGTTGDLDGELRDLAHRQLRAALEPAVVQLRRLVIAEAGRFPELGRAFHERGPGRTIATLTQTFARLAEQGFLQIADPATAATQFKWLVMAHPVNQVMLLGDEHALDNDQLGRHVRGAVDLFLAVYRATREVPTYDKHPV